MSELFVAEGSLIFVWQPGYAGWYLKADSYPQDLGDMVAEHFGLERLWPSGNRVLEGVKITIERAEERDG